MEHIIDKKRQKVALEAIFKAEKEKQKAKFTNVGTKGKGGVPNTKLRGITDSDFFQKNNTGEKGWTF